jgi:hypothetical protein
LEGGGVFKEGGGTFALLKSILIAGEKGKIAGRQAGKFFFMPYSVAGDMKLDVPLNYYGPCAYRRAISACFLHF